MALTVPRERRPVELGRRVPVPLDSAIALLEHDPELVLGRRIGGRHVAREVRVGYGRMMEDEGVVALPVWWEDAEHPHLFPTFDGGLELRPDGEGTELLLVGSYRPPLGAFGRFADGLVGHRVVAASLEAFLAAAAERLLTAC